jgi:predicted methyltransferase
MRIAPLVCTTLALALVPAFVCPGGARAQDTQDLAARLASESRPAEDRARDAERKPLDVLAFLGVQPGMTAIDLIAAGGYNTEVLALAVGETGKVYAHNTPLTLSMREGANEKAITARLAGGRLPNVERADSDIAKLDLPAGSIDVAITSLNFHDVYQAGGAEPFLARVRELLKPGGVLGIIDHVGVAGNDNRALHRIETSLVREAAEAAGFTLDGESGVLRNTEDDHTKSVFDPSVRGKTDRLVLRLRKPAGA